MVPSVTTVLQRFKTDWAAQLQPEAISAACEAVGYTAWRDRLLNPVSTVQLFLLQILHGNTACRHLPHLAGFYCSASAYCQARAKLPIRVLELTFRTPSDGKPRIFPGAFFARTTIPRSVMLCSHKRRYTKRLRPWRVVWVSCSRPSKRPTSNICPS